MCACSAVSSSFSLAYASLRYWTSLVSLAPGCSAMTRFLPGIAGEKPRGCRADADTCEREDHRHHRKVAADPGEQQPADQADAHQQQPDRQHLPPATQREQDEAEQPEREHDVVVAGPRDRVARVARAVPHVADLAGHHATEGHRLVARVVHEVLAADALERLVARQVRVAVRDA